MNLLFFKIYSADTLFKKKVNIINKDELRILINKNYIKNFLITLIY